jgi:hypothetical protein
MRECSRRDAYPLQILLSSILALWSEGTLAFAHDSRIAAKQAASKFFFLSRARGVG